MANRSVAADATFAEFRKTYLETSTDIGDITTLGNSFGGTPTDLVEKVNQAPSVGFALAMCVALG
tara:strand:- start:197 stop:391 length:195 start_codon:yes stop_codon:yes gene_type:complete